MALLAELRSATRDVHDQLETRLDIMKRVRDRLSYTHFLVGMHSVYAPLEQSISACALTRLVMPDWDCRRKTPWLVEDLRALGAQSAAAVKVDVATLEDVLGAMYVMEGATLGGAVILRALGSVGSLAPHRFFHGYGDKGGARWSAFRSHMAAIEGTELDHVGVIDAARRTFRAVEEACVELVRD